MAGLGVATQNSDVNVQNLQCKLDLCRSEKASLAKKCTWRM